MSVSLEQESTSFFQQRVEKDIFQAWLATWSLSQMFNSAVVAQSSLSTQADEHVWVPQTCLWTLKFEFHMTFTSLSIIFLLFYFFLTTKTKAILSLWAVRKQALNPDFALWVPRGRVMLVYEWYEKHERHFFSFSSEVLTR